ncbi:MAG TPA: glycoside hydrolase family 57 protein [Candidatus Gracilibacteria bacterium]
MAKSICFYFQIHQPYRLSHQPWLAPKAGQSFFDGASPHRNREVFEKVATKSYIPMLSILKELLEQYPDFTFSLSLSGVFLEQCQEYAEPLGTKVLDLLKSIARTDRVEFLAETYYHSLSFLYSKLDFIEQVELHGKVIKGLFGQKPQVFRHTELLYRDDLATWIYELGYRGMLAEGWHTALPDDNPNLVRKAHLCELPPEDWDLIKEHKRTNFGKPKHLPVLTKNYKLSDDMAFRFGDRNWESYPLLSEDYLEWIAVSPGDTVNLFMDFETFGEHQWEDTGIFEFFKAIPAQAKARNIDFKTPSETIKAFPAQGTYHAPHWISWADTDRDLSAWIENEMQHSALGAIKETETLLHPLRTKTDRQSLQLWDEFRRLQTSDHLYYMSTKYWADGDVHTYFSPYESPYDAYINFMNTLTLLQFRIQEVLKYQSSKNA